MSAAKLIVVDTGNRNIHLLENDQILKTFPIAIGKPQTPTPFGQYSLINKIKNPGGILGSRWMGLNYDTYGIHGTSDPSSIGRAVSLGCIRLYNRDVEVLFEEVQVGTRVTIVPRFQPGTTPNWPTPAASYPTQTFATPSGSSNSYQIKSGDTMWQIAQRLGLPLQRLLDANPGINPHTLQPGQNLAIPGR